MCVKNCPKSYEVIYGQTLNGVTYLLVPSGSKGVDPKNFISMFKLPKIGLRSNKKLRNKKLKILVTSLYYHLLIS